MRTGRTLLFTMVALTALSLGGCKKKHKTTDDVGRGRDGGGTLDPDAGDRTPITPPIVDRDIHEGDEPGGPLRDVYFDFDQYAIRGDQRPTLDSNGNWLMSNAGKNVLVEGHCDERGTEEYNLALGDKRANATRDYLRTLGVPTTRMQTISYGKAYPADPGHSESAWAKNRRSHFTIVAPGKSR